MCNVGIVLNKKKKSKKESESILLNEPVKLHLDLKFLKCQQQQQEEGTSRRFPFNYNAASGSTHSLITVLRTTAEPTGCLFISRQAG